MCAGPVMKASLSYFDGFNHLPHFTTQLMPGQTLVALRRTYAPLRMVGGDAAVPLQMVHREGRGGMVGDQQHDV